MVSRRSLSDQFSAHVYDEPEDPKSPSDYRYQLAVMLNHKGDPVAVSQIDHPHSDADYHGHLQTEYPEGASAQGRFVGPGMGVSRSHVSMAAVGPGAPSGAAYELLAMSARRSGMTPWADSALTPEGAVMSRMAAKRGLVKPHPDNPTMTANQAPFQTQWTLRGAVSDMKAAGEEHPERITAFTGDERHNARAVIYAKRAKAAKPQGTQPELGLYPHGEQLHLWSRKP